MEEIPTQTSSRRLFSPHRSLLSSICEDHFSCMGVGIHRHMRKTKPDLLEADCPSTSVYISSDVRIYKNIHCFIHISICTYVQCNTPTHSVIYIYIYGGLKLSRKSQGTEAEISLITVLQTHAFSRRLKALSRLAYCACAHTEA